MKINNLLQNNKMTSLCLAGGGSGLDTVACPAGVSGPVWNQLTGQSRKAAEIRDSGALAKMPGQEKARDELA
jgi:hypothetical protein